jgi:hypothetical protein
MRYSDMLSVREALMAFIDLSDPEEMLSLLIEYVEDEKSEADSDKRRYAFLSSLVETLLELEQEFTALSGTARVERLNKIIAEFDMEFEHDPVVEHFSALVEELERINSSKT